MFVYSNKLISFELIFLSHLRGNLTARNVISNIAQMLEANLFSEREREGRLIKFHAPMNEEKKA